MTNIERLLVSLIILIGSQFYSLKSSSADFIIFSYDRPMQLYALLESTEHYLSGIADTIVLYRTSDERFSKAYDKVKLRFPHVQFQLQGSSPQADFQPLFLHALKAGNSPYILFAPDDIIVKNYADLGFCINKMEEYGTYGFFLRLGTHLKSCYALNKQQPLPPLTDLGNNLLCWTFKNGTLDWGYPNNVDMTIYRKSDILPILENKHYTNPNTLESIWAGTQGSISNKKGLCFRDSIIVNIPINRVQKDEANNFMNSWTTKQLLEFFEAGKKIDIEPLANIKNESCHINYEVAFVHMYLITPS